MTNCKNCAKHLTQSPIGRSREYCDRACGEAYRKRVKVESTGQQKLVLVTRSPYNLPFHLMVQDGPKLVMPAPASR